MNREDVISFVVLLIVGLSLIGFIVLPIGDPLVCQWYIRPQIELTESYDNCSLNPLSLTGQCSNEGENPDYLVVIYRDSGYGMYCSQ